MRIENNGNAEFTTNGEKYFINKLFLTFVGRKEPLTIFDIGANLGDYTQMLMQKASQYGTNVTVHLFEPTRGCFSELRERFTEPEIILNNFGLSDVEGTREIYYDKKNSGLASLYQRNLDSYGLTLHQSERVTLRRLDYYIETSNLQHINFIKVDIEGHELSALEGFGEYLNPEFIDYIQFEYGGANLDSHTSLMEIYNYLTAKGFHIAKVMPKGLEIREYHPDMENFNYSNYVAISKEVCPS